MKKILSVVLLAGLIWLIYSQLGPTDSGDKAPNFEGKLMDGSSFSLVDLRGDYVLLDFWGSWCPPCRRDNPNLVDLYNSFNGKDFKDAEGFEIVSVALDKNDKGWKRAIEKDGLRWKYHILRTSRLVATDALALKYKVTDLPTKFLIGPDGDIIGINMTKKEIEDYLKSG